VGGDGREEGTPSPLTQIPGSVPAIPVPSLAPHLFSLLSFPQILLPSPLLSPVVLHSSFLYSVALYFPVSPLFSYLFLLAHRFSPFHFSAHTLFSPFRLFSILFLQYGMVNVDLYSAIITKVSNALNTLVS